MGSPEGLPYGGYRICGYSVGTGEENRSRQEGYAHCQLKIGTEAQGCGGGRKAEDVPDHLLAHLSPLGWEHINLTGDYVWGRPSITWGVLRIGLVAADQESGMKWRILVELAGADGSVQSHEISVGGCGTIDSSAETLGLTLADGKKTLAGLQRHLV